MNIEDVDELQDLRFTTYLSDGSEIELVENGRAKKVDATNVSDYITKVVHNRLHESELQISALYEGNQRYFNENVEDGRILNFCPTLGLSAVLPVELFPLFTPSELERYLCGVRNVDIDLLQQCTEYTPL
jgi:hypothetical protein